MASSSACVDARALLLLLLPPFIVQASVFWSWTTLQHFVLEIGAVTLHVSTALHSITSRSGLQALNYCPPPQTSQDHVSALGGRVLLQCSHRASHRRPSLVVRSTSVTWRLYQCSTTEKGTEATDCKPNQKTVKWDISVDGVHSILGILCRRRIAI